MARRRPQSEPEPEAISVHQVVAYNFRRAREEKGWTQDQTSDELAPYLGYRLRQAGVSAIEKTFDSERKRNLDVGEVAAFARCFDLPLAWFFTPPPEMTSLPLATPGPEDPPEKARANLAELLSIAIGTPTGWEAFVDRIRELLASDADEDATHQAVYYPLGGVTRPEYDEQLDLRRRALRDVRLAQRATPADEVIQQMAGLLVDLVKLTPTGFQALAEEDPESALRLLAEANEHVEPIIERNEALPNPAAGSGHGFDKLERVAPDDLLGGQAEG
ncbi:hypothetical protein BH23ACT2_BH23ACT2_11730 [soil metagenome]